MKKVFLGAVAYLGISGLVQKYRQASIDEKVFRELLSGLTIGPTPEAALHRVAERAAKLVHATAVYVERLDSERRELVATALHGQGLPPVGTRGPYWGSLAEQAIDSGRAIIVSNVKSRKPFHSRHVCAGFPCSRSTDQSSSQPTRRGHCHSKNAAPDQERHRTAASVCGLARCFSAACHCVGRVGAPPAGIRGGSAA